jgi:ABC-type sugar transport system substrate-binding protein
MQPSPTSSRSLMTVSRAISNPRTTSTLLLGLAGVALLGPAVAQQATPPLARQAAPVVVVPLPDFGFRQAVQQQQARDQLQQSQLEQQLRQGVSKNASRPTAADPKVQQQLDQAAQAQLNRDHASQQNLLNQYHQTPELPRVVPKPLPPPDASKQDH